MIFSPDDTQHNSVKEENASFVFRFICIPDLVSVCFLHSPVCGGDRNRFMSWLWKPFESTNVMQNINIFFSSILSDKDLEEFS